MPSGTNNYYESDQDVSDSESTHESEEEAVSSEQLYGMRAAQPVYNVVLNGRLLRPIRQNRLLFPNVSLDENGVENIIYKPLSVVTSKEHCNCFGCTCIDSEVGR
ncbi:MAG: hypothetical protein AMJ43_07870 [Coxiella sp. DG_40]|nr:MAG: hypothetical protein AMJ43_07870 [Coxiella sp. DG_40]